MLLLIVPLCALPLAGLGALLGTSFRTPEETMAVDRLVTLLLLVIGPVLIPPERLPDLLVTLGHLSPATYAASALRQGLLGPVTGRIMVDILVLCAFTCISFWLVNRKMDWRTGA